MGKIIKTGVEYSGGGGGSGQTYSAGQGIKISTNNVISIENPTAKQVELTQAEYDALTEEQKTDGTIYFITDSPSSSSATLAEVLENGNTANNTIILNDDSGSSDLKNSISAVNMVINGKTPAVETRFNAQAGTSAALGLSRTLLDSPDGTSSCMLYMSDNGGQTKVEFTATSDVKQAIRDGLNIADRNYTTAEKKVGTFLGKDLYEITLTGISINAAPDSGQVTWYNLTQNKGIQTSWDIVDYEVLSRIADNTSSATRSVMDGLILRGGGNSNWTIGNKYQSAMYIRVLTLRYVKETL